MRVKKIMIIVLIGTLILLTGCASNKTPEALWNRYIEAMNTHNIEEVAQIYYTKDSTAFNRFIDEKDPEEYFADFTSAKTISFDPEIVNEKYYSATVSINYTFNGAKERKDFNVYFVKNMVNEWSFVSEVNISAYDIALLGNQPDKNFYTNVVKSNNEYDYKYIYGTQPGVESDSDHIKIVYPKSNAEKIIIPNEIDGKPVEIIGDFAFFNYFKILSVTFSKSRLREVVLPNTLTTIEKFAFYQTKNLKTVTLPTSLKNVGKYAFAGSGLESLYINVDESAMYGDGNLVSLSSKDSMTINGDKYVYVNDNNTYFSVSGGLVNWSTSDQGIATINATGKLSATAAGTVIIRATNKYDPTLYTEAEVYVLPATDKLVTSTATNDNFAFTTKKNWFVGESSTLSVTSGQVTWSTSDQSIATIDDTGKLTAVGEGPVTITAKSVSNPTEFYSNAIIYVNPASEKSVVTNYFNYTPITFTGARKMYVADWLKLNAEGHNIGEIFWSTSDASIASVHIYDGVVMASKKGTATIKATSANNPNIFSTVAINVSDVETAITFQENSLDRLNNLKAIYMNAINPYSVSIKGTLKIPADCKIYVPEQNYQTYLIVWSNYAKQIYAIPKQ